MKNLDKHLKDFLKGEVSAITLPRFLRETITAIKNQEFLIKSLMASTFEKLMKRTEEYRFPEIDELTHLILGADERKRYFKDEVETREN